jgi:hypothetical protein
VAAGTMPAITHHHALRTHVRFRASPREGAIYRLRDSRCAATLRLRGSGVNEEYDGGLGRWIKLGSWVLLTSICLLAAGCGDDDDETTDRPVSASLGTGTSPSSSATTSTSTVSPTTGAASSQSQVQTLPPIETDPTTAPHEGFELPESPGGPGADRNRDIYRALRDGQCEQAADDLNRHWDSSNPEERTIRSARDVLIFQSGIDLCRGDASGARHWLDQATAMGLQGLAEPVRTKDDTTPFFAWYCEVYRSVVSVLDTVPRDSVDCPGGDPPTWPPGPRDDPRTAIDESTVSTTDEDAQTGTSTSSSIASTTSAASSTTVKAGTSTTAKVAPTSTRPPSAATSTTTD